MKQTAVLLMGWFLMGAAAPARAEAPLPAPTSAPALTPPPIPDALSPASQPTPTQRGSIARSLLRQAIDLYVVGRYKDAAEKLRPLVETKILKDRADQKEALRAYGISLYLSGARAGAERAFRELLRLDSREQLDPGYVRPEVVAFFQWVRQRHQAELTLEMRKRGPTGHAVANLVPPWGQFQNGHRKKGYAILGGELGLVAASVVSAALLYSWRDSTHQFPGKEDEAEALMVVNYVSLGALAALVVYGIVDGLYYYYRVPEKPELDPRPTNAAGPAGLLSGYSTTALIRF